MARNWHQSLPASSALVMTGLFATVLARVAIEGEGADSLLTIWCKASCLIYTSFFPSSRGHSIKSPLKGNITSYGGIKPINHKNINCSSSSLKLLHVAWVIIARCRGNSGRTVKREFKCFFEKFSWKKWTRWRHRFRFVGTRNLLGPVLVLIGAKSLFTKVVFDLESSATSFRKETKSGAVVAV